MGNENGKQRAQDKTSLVNKGDDLYKEKGKGESSVDLDFSNVGHPEKSSEQVSLPLQSSVREKESEQFSQQPNIVEKSKRPSEEFTKSKLASSLSDIPRQQSETVSSVSPRHHFADVPVYGKNYFTRQDESFVNDISWDLEEQPLTLNNVLDRTVRTELQLKRDEPDASAQNSRLLHDRVDSLESPASQHLAGDRHSVVSLTDNGNRDISVQIRQTLEAQCQIIRNGVTHYQKSNRQILKLLTERERQLEERSQQHVAQLNELEFALESLQTRSEKKDIAIAVLSDVVDKLTNQIDLLTNAAENRSQVSDIDCADPDSESTSPVSETPAQQDDENEVGLEETVVCTKREEEPKESQTRRQPKEAVNTTRSENRRNEDVVKRLSRTEEARRSISPETRHSRTEEKEWDSNIEWTLPDPVPVQEQPIKHVSLGHWIDIANEEIANGKAFSVGNGCGPCTVLCFDVSDSMKGDPFRHMIILGLRFVKGIEKSQHTQEKEKIALVTFGHETKVISHLSIDYSTLKEKIKRLRPGGPSPLMGAVALAFGCIRGTMKPHKTVPSRVIFFTDGLVTQSAITGGPDMFSRTENLAKLMEIDQECMAHQENILPQMRKEHIRIHFVPLGAAVINPHMLSVSKKTNGRIVRPKDIDRLTKHSQYAMMVTKLKEAKKTGKEFELPDDLTSDDMDELQDMMKFDPSVTVDDSDESGSEQGDGQTANSENDPNMPPLGTRVRRGPDWNSNWDHQDSNGPGTVVSHTKKGWIWIMWDNGHRNQYPYGKNGNFGVIAVDEPRILEQNQLIEPGCLVTRGPDWRDNDKDGGAGSVGAVFRKHHDGSVGVRWPSGIMRRYKFGKGGFFEVKICDPYDPEVQAAVASGGKTKISLKDPTLDDTVNEEDVKKKSTAHAQKNTSIDEMNKRNAMKQTIGETSGRNATEENKQNVSNFDEKTQTVDKSVEEMNRRNTVQNKSPGKSSTSLVEEMNMRNANKGPPDGLGRDDTDIDGPKEDVELTDDGYAKELGGIKEVVIPEDKRGNDKSVHSDCTEEMDTTLDMTNKDVRTNENLTDQTQSDKHGSMHESRRDGSDGQNSEIRNVNENLLGAKPKVPTKGQVNMTDTMKEGQMRQDVHEVRTKMNGKTVKSEKERKKDNVMLATSLRTSSFDEPDEEEITNVFTPPQITQDHVTTESKNRTGTLSTMGNVSNISANSHLQKSSNLSDLKDSNTGDLDLDGGDHDLSFEHNSVPSPVASDDGSSRKMSMTSSGTQSVVEDLSSSFSSEASSHSREEDADGQQDDDVVWQRKGENGGWVNFSPDVSAKIERAYRRNPKTTTSYLENKKRFKVMLSNMTLVHPTTKQMTGIRRLADYKK